MKMYATFRDRVGMFTIEDVANIQYNKKDNVYSVMFTDYSTEEYTEAELVEVNMEGF